MLAASGVTLVGAGEPSAPTTIGAPPGADAATMIPVEVTAMDNLLPRPTVRPGDGPFQPGQQVGPRYTIIRLLGTGGMGAVYQAFDHELGVAVAIKVIRPAAQSDATAAKELEQRFKRELVLARQITHKHVVRIHDLGDVDGIKYLTMPIVEGETLAELLQREGKLPVPRALIAARQIALGLAAAHDKGVVHRDLKPENIMIEKSDGDSAGDALIMDFGIARSVQHGATQTAAGSVIGTLEYMAPEQAQGKQVDQRADVYAFGLILYDMLLGRQRLAGGDNAMTELMARMAAPPRPPRAVDAQIPEALDQIVQRCLQPSPEARFASTAALVESLEALTPEGFQRPDSATLSAVAAPSQARPKWHMVATAVVVAAIVGAGVWLLSNREGSAVEPVARAPISVLVAEFENKTGDAVFDGVLEQALALGIEGASFITAYPRRDALRSAAAIKAGSRLDEQTARLVAVRDGIKMVLLGTVSPAASGYAMSVRAVDAADGKAVVSAAATASDKAGVLAAVGEMATTLRRDLGDTTADGADIGRETFTAASLEAAQAYVRAQELAQGGKFTEAIPLYEEAVERDPNFGRAYSGWAVSATVLGRASEADALYKKAMALTERMTEREKYRTLGGYYLGPGANDEQAITNYRALVERYPSDEVGWNNLGVAYFNTLDFKRAQENGRRALDIYPIVRNRTNLALYAMYAGDFDAAAAEARAAIAMQPRDLAYLPLAVAAAMGSQPDEATRAYADMANTGPRGAAISGMGRADLALYYGKFDEAAALLREGTTVDAKANQPAQQAQKLAALAEISIATGARAQAAADVRAALALSTSEAVVVPAGRVLIALGQEAEARKLAQILETEVQKRRRAFGATLVAEIALKQGRPLEAIDALTTARSLADLWLVRFTLGRVYIEAGRYAEGLAEMEACASRRGEAAAVFLNDVPTLRYMVPVSYWMARAQDGLGQADSAVKGYTAYLELRGKVTGDPLAADARKRLASR